MAYKSILTVITNPKLSQDALNWAIEIARKNDAHLDVLCLGVDRTQTGYYYAGANAMITQETMERAANLADEAEEWVTKQLTGETVNWAAEKVVAQMVGLGRIISLRSRFADLVVLPQPYGKNHGAEDEAVIEAAMFEGQAPVLVIPNGAEVVDFDRAVIGWNESAESLAATRAALPILTAADSVNISVIDPPQHGPNRSDPGGALSQLLVRHGVRTEISVLAKTMPRVSDVLMRHVEDQDARLLVMGAYGHSRFREAILGGATRDMLEKAPVPVLMTH